MPHNMFIGHNGFYWAAGPMLQQQPAFVQGQFQAQPAPPQQPLAEVAPAPVQQGNMLDTRHKEFWVDGGCKRNGRANAAAYGSISNGAECMRFPALEGARTNNEAEYRILEVLLESLVAEGNPNCTIYTDSALVYGQTVKGWKCKTPSLHYFRHRVQQLLMAGKHKLVQVPREEIVKKVGH